VNFFFFFGGFFFFDPPEVPLSLYALHTRRTKRGLQKRPPNSPFPFLGGISVTHRDEQRRTKTSAVSTQEKSTLPGFGDGIH